MQLYTTAVVIHAPKAAIRALPELFLMGTPLFQPVAMCTLERFFLVSMRFTTDSHGFPRYATREPTS